MSDTILVLDAGSSSVRFQLLAADEGDALDRRLKGLIEGIGTSHPRFLAHGLASVDESPAAAELATVPQAVTGGLDALVFTGGIGEHSAPIRSRVCDRLLWPGLEIDHGANARGERRISSPHARAAACIVPTGEERMIALHCRDLLHRRQRLPAAA